MSNLQIDGRKTLRDLYEEGVIYPGCELRIRKQFRSIYKSSKEKNGVTEQSITSFELPNSLRYKIVEKEKDLLFVLGEVFFLDFQLGGINGYLYGASELNDICHGFFSSKYLRARSINLDDINKILRIELINDDFVLNPGTERAVKICSRQKVITSKHTYTPSSYAKGVYEKPGTELVLNNESFEGNLLEVSQFKKRLIFQTDSYYLATQGSYKYIDSIIAYGLDAITGIQKGTSCITTNMFYSSGDEWHQSDKGIRPVGYIYLDTPIEEIGIEDIIIPKIHLKIS